VACGRSKYLPKICQVHVLVSMVMLRLTTPKSARRGALQGADQSDLTQ